MLTRPHERESRKKHASVGTNSKIVLGGIEGGTLKNRLNRIEKECGKKNAWVETNFRIILGGWLA